MATINNIKELKEAIKDLPDDMYVAVYAEGNGDLHSFGKIISTPEKMKTEFGEDVELDEWHDTSGVFILAIH